LTTGIAAWEGSRNEKKTGKGVLLV